jgi:nitrate/nitrite transporter NarK
MKKYLGLIVLMVGLVISTTAQRATTMPLAAGDTVTNTGTATKTLPVITDGYQGAVVQVIVTRLSGTAAGTVGLYGSLDGTNYRQIGSDYTVTNVASQNHVFYVTGPLPNYLRVLETGSGTMSAVLTVKYLLRRVATTRGT